LATDENLITLRVADRAGNVTETNIDVTLDFTGDTTAPELQLIWPTNDMHISGSSFYLRGKIDDETATLTARIIDANDVTNDVIDLVERNGMFWVEGLPLAAGTNSIELTATDARGNVNTTSFNVVQSSVTLTIDSTPTGSVLYEPTGTVYGTVSDPNYAVTVNGVAAEVDEYGNWSAQNVPNYGQGTSTFDAQATAGGNPPVQASRQEEQPAEVKITRHLVSLRQENWGSSYTRTKTYQAGYEPGEDGAWVGKYQGQASELDIEYWEGFYAVNSEWSDTDPVGTYRTESPWGNSGPEPIPDESAQVKDVPDCSLDHVEHSTMGVNRVYVSHYYGKGVRHEWPGMLVNPTVFVAARTVETLYTGGKAEVARKAIFSLSASAWENGKPQNFPWQFTGGEVVVPERIELLGEALNSEGRLLVALPENQQIAMNLRVKSVPHLSAGSGTGKARLSISSVTFKGEFSTNYHTVLVDTNGAGYSPHWQTNAVTGQVQSGPALYVSGSRVVAGAGFAVGGGGIGETMVVRGKASGFTLWGTNTIGAGTFSVTAIADTPVAANKVDYLNPLTIEWSYAGVKDATGKLTEFVDAGQSSSPVYVSLKTPSTDSLYHTVVHLACSTPGATTPDAAFANTWSHFSGKAVKTWDDQPLHYYKTGTTFLQNMGSAAALLQDTNHSGGCDAFVDLLHSAAGVNGVWTTNVTLKPSTPYGANKFLVKNWSFTGGQTIWWFVFATGSADMVVGQSGHNFLDCTDILGLAGQNSPWPSQKVFDNHRIIQKGTVYYDPSYGFSSNSKRNYEEAAVAGYGTLNTHPDYPTQYGMLVQPISEDPQTVGLEFE
jgi:hypothetical protein